MANSSPSCTNSETSTVKLIARSVPVLGGLVDDLIEGRKNIVSKLDFSNGSMTYCGNSYCESCDALL